ncbi:MAG: hypothetical protein BRC36_12980, partial [Cyanobacteria bacterium QH_2_48_84]
HPPKAHAIEIKTQVVSLHFWWIALQTIASHELAATILAQVTLLTVFTTIFADSGGFTSRQFIPILCNAATFYGVSESRAMDV